MRHLRRPAAERLEDFNLSAGIGDVVLPANHMRDVRIHIIHHGRHGVEEASVFADQDGIGHRGGVDRLGTTNKIGPGHRPAGQAETPVRPTPLGFERLPVRRRQGQSRPVIDRRPSAGQGDLTASVELVRGFITGIKPARLTKLSGGLLVTREPIRLTKGLVPVEAEPGQIVAYSLFVFSRGSLSVCIVDPENEHAAFGPCEQPVDQRRPDIADMQLARRRWGETDLGRHEGGTLDEGCDPNWTGTLPRSGGRWQADPSSCRRERPDAGRQAAIDIIALVSTSSARPAALAPTPPVTGDVARP